MTFDLEGKAVRRLRLPTVNYSNSPPQMAWAQKGDTNSRYFSVSLYDDRGDINIEKYSKAILYVVLPDETVEFIDAEISDKAVICKLTSSMLEDGGKIACYVKLIGKDGDDEITSLTSQAFSVAVSYTPSEEDVVGGQENYGLLIELLMDIDELEKAVKKAEEQISKSVFLPVYNDQTYTITFETQKGEVLTIDLPLEALTKDLDFDPATNELIVYRQDGTTLRIPLTALIDVYMGATTPTVQITISNDNKISATILNGSITEEHLSTTLKTTIGNKVDKVPSKSLIADSEITRLTEIATGAQVNVIEGIQKNGVTIVPTNKTVNIVVPTQAVDIGLGNVNNTSDIDKPISTATQIALDEKQAILVSGANIKTINGQSVLGSGNMVIEGGGGGGGGSGGNDISTKLYYEEARGDIRKVIINEATTVDELVGKAINIYSMQSMHNDYLYINDFERMEIVTYQRGTGVLSNESTNIDNNVIYTVFVIIHDGRYCAYLVNKNYEFLGLQYNEMEPAIFSMEQIGTNLVDSPSFVDALGFSLFENGNLLETIIQEMLFSSSTLMDNLPNLLLENDDFVQQLKLKLEEA